MRQDHLAAALRRSLIVIATVGSVGLVGCAHELSNVSNKEKGAAAGVVAGALVAGPIGAVVGGVGGYFAGKTLGEKVDANDRAQVHSPHH